ncbi:hypothetical protein HHI36_001282 [Cryptolaemus montrouzieri]|uniref:Uncharacterized protein n=1 Tax=Cryptolaemus montrouzieri TaxID=559131 RepID=A0ABD2P767_9CUCU
MALLNYQFLQGNLRGYSEIIKWCQCKEVPLPCIYIEKYFRLLLKKQDVKNI